MASKETAPPVAQTFPALLESLSSCLTSTASSLPAPRKSESSDVSIEPPQDGISLLDTKSEILLSYLHNLVFLIIFQLRQTSSNQNSEQPDTSLRDEAVKKLVELRTFLDRGVRPLEGRLKYQVDKVVKAAEDTERTERPAKSSKSTKADRASSPDSDQASSDEESGSGSENDSEEEDGEDFDEMAYRPNVSAFSKAKVEQQQPRKTASQAPSDGIYRPPKIMPTAIPQADRQERENRRPRRSNVIDEFVSAEMSSAPVAEPSIGSTIIAGGRQSKSKKDREREAERAAYEETNFVRLPKETKKELAKRGGGRRDTTFGGDEWKGLTEGADRIERLTRRSRNGGAALDKSRKRKANEDGPRSSGAGMGEMFDKRRKKVDSWKR